MNKIGTHYGYWVRDWDVDYCAYIRRAAKVGFDVMEFNPMPLIGAPAGRIEEIKKTADGCGITLAFCGGLAADADVSSPDLKKREKGLADLEELCEITARMGGSGLSGILYSTWPYPKPGILNDKGDMWNYTVESIRQSADTAKGYGITYHLEVVNRFECPLINDHREGLRFVRQVDRPNVDLHLDTFHMVIEETSIRRAILDTGSRIGHFHVGQNNRMPPGPQGDVMDWGMIFGALKEAGYTGMIVMEPFVTMGGEVGRDICVWRNLLDNYGEAYMDGLLTESIAYIKSFL